MAKRLKKRKGKPIKFKDKVTVRLLRGSIFLAFRAFLDPAVMDLLYICKMISIRTSRSKNLYFVCDINKTCWQDMYVLEDPHP